MKNIILDTNAYRSIIENKNYEEIRLIIERIRGKELDLGYLSYQSLTVIQELFNHLENQSRHYEKCKKALQACFFHNFWKATNQEYGYKCYYVYTYENQIRNYLNVSLSNDVKKYEISVINFMKEFTPEISDEVIVKCRKNFEINKNNWQGSRTSFVSSLLETIEDNITNITNTQLSKEDKDKRTAFRSQVINTRRFNIELTKGILMKYCNNISLTLLEQTIDKIEPAIEFMRSFYNNSYDGLQQKNQKIIENGIADVTRKNWNSIHDFEIMLEALLSNSILVTREDNIIKIITKKCLI